MSDPYVPVVFEAWPSTNTPITAARLNAMQAVVVGAADEASASALSAAGAAAAAASAATAPTRAEIGVVLAEEFAAPETPASQAVAAATSAAVVPAVELATGKRPTGITGTHAGLWNSRLSLYNAEPRRLRKSRGRLMESRIPGKRLMKIVCVGDSITAAEGSGSPRDLAAFPASFQSALVAAGYRMAGDGWVQPNAFESTAATRPTQWVRTSGTWAGFAGGGQLVSFLASATPSATLTFTSTLPGDTLEFTWLRNAPPFFAYSIDGGAWVDVTTQGSVLDYRKETVTGLNPANTHSVAFRLAPDYPTTSPVHIGPARVYNSVDKGLLIANAGVGGSSSPIWRSDAQIYYIGPTTLALNNDVDLVILEPMIYNDINGAFSVATHKANIQSIITTYRALPSAPDVLLVVPGRPSSAYAGAGSFDAYRTASYELADALGLPLIDFGERFGPFVEANADGYYADTLHLTTAGYGDMGRAVAAALLAE